MASTCWRPMSTLTFLIARLSPYKTSMSAHRPRGCQVADRLGALRHRHGLDPFMALTSVLESVAQDDRRGVHHDQEQQQHDDRSRGPFDEAGCSG
jgi:hypothetical protein